MKHTLAGYSEVIGSHDKGHPVQSALVCWSLGDRRLRGVLPCHPFRAGNG